MKTKRKEISDMVGFYNAAGLTSQAIQQIQQQRNISTPSALFALMLMEAECLENKGVYVAYSHYKDSEDSEDSEDSGQLCEVYIGLYAVGIIAAYYVSTDEWHLCQSHGNGGKNYACGGTWSTTAKHKERYVPPLVAQVIKAL